MNEQGRSGASIINDQHLIGDDDKRIWYGKYAGTKWTHLPAGYLKWMVNECGPDIDKAERELERRGTILDTQDMEISPHAVDRASQYALDIWKKKREGNEGLYHWLHRVACEAFNMLPHHAERAEWGKLIFVFKRGRVYNTLITVIRDRRYKNGYE